MQPQDVTRVFSDPLAQEFMQFSIPARLAYLGPNGFPRVSVFMSTTPRMISPTTARRATPVTGVMSPHPIVLRVMNEK